MDASGTYSANGLSTVVPRTARFGWSRRLTKQGHLKLAGDTRRLEDLGLGHAALPGATTAQVLLAPGATRSPHLGDADPRELVDAVSCLAPGFRDRLHAWPTTRHVVPPRLNDVPHEPGTGPSGARRVP